MQTTMQKLIDEIVEHLTYDDDLTDDSRNTLEKMRIKCESKLEMEKQQIIDAYQAGDGDAYNLGETEGWAKEYYIETYGSKGSDEIKTDKI